MGMPFIQSTASRRRVYSPPTWQNTARPERVTISMDADCLARLLESRQLHVQDIACQDAESRERVRRLLLALVTASR